MGKRRRTLRRASSWLNASIIGIQFPVAMVIGFLWGRWMDNVFGTKPWLTLVFSLCGIAAGFLNLFRLTMAATREEEREARMEAEEAQADEDRNGGRAGG